MIKNGGTVLKSDLQSQDVFVCECSKQRHLAHLMHLTAPPAVDSGLHIWVWQGAQASNNEKGERWLT